MRKKIMNVVSLLAVLKPLLSERHRTVEATVRQKCARSDNFIFLLVSLQLSISRGRWAGNVSADGISLSLASARMRAERAGGCLYQMPWKSNAPDKVAALHGISFIMPIWIAR